MRICLHGSFDCHKQQRKGSHSPVALKIVKKGVGRNGRAICNEQNYFKYICGLSSLFLNNKQNSLGGKFRLRCIWQQAE